MRLSEIKSIDRSTNVDEGWKSWATAAGIGAAALGMSVGDKFFGQDHQPKHASNVVDRYTLAKKMIASAKNNLERTLIQHATAAGIDGDELRQFMAQCAHETNNFTTLVEMGSVDYFTKRYDKTKAPSKAKILGNIYAGDGALFRGRGFIQLTGRYWYRKAGEALGIPLEEQPEMLEQPEIAAKVSVWYWKTVVSPKVSNFSDVNQATKKINPGMHGMSSRQAHFDRYASLE